MPILDRKKLLQKEKLEIVQVDLGKGEITFVRQMTGRERDQFERSLIREVKDVKGNLDYVRSLEDFRAKLAVNTLCDESGEALLLPNDVSTLSQNMSAFRLEKIVNAAQKLNAITEADKEALVKNLEGGRAASSNSDSAKN